MIMDSVHDGRWTPSTPPAPRRDPTPAHIIALAKAWCDGWDFVEIESVTWKNISGGLWWPPTSRNPLARIELGWDNGVDLLYHEAFHSVWHLCPLRQTDGWWGEAWCNAFSESVRGVFYPFVDRKFEDADIEYTSHERQYLKPCDLLLKEVGRCPVNLLKLFRRMNRIARHGHAGFFTDYMEFDPNPRIPQPLTPIQDERIITQDPVGD